MSATASKSAAGAHLGDTQHTPDAPDGADGFIGYVYWLRAQFPEPDCTFAAGTEKRVPSGYSRAGCETPG
jgi:hypothetical protein